MAQCKIPGCSERTKGLGLCQRHYDVIYCKIRQERDKIRKKECPFLYFENPYRQKSGYYIIFEIIRQHRPLTTDQILRLSRIELVKKGITDYRIDYAFEVLKAKKHASKKGDYLLKQDPKGCWNLTKPRREVNNGKENL